MPKCECSTPLRSCCVVSLLSCANSDATTVSVLFVAVYRKYISELPMSVPFAELAEGLTVRSMMHNHACARMTYIAYDRHIMYHVMYHVHAHVQLHLHLLHLHAHAHVHVFFPLSKRCRFSGTVVSSTYPQHYSRPHVPPSYFLQDKLDEIKLCSLSLMTDLLVATKGTKPNSKKDIGKMVVDAILSMLEPKSKVRCLGAKSPCVLT